MPRGPHPSDPWVEATYALIESFERDLSALSAGVAADVIEVPSILAASDYLWVRFGLRASWQQLSVMELFAMFAGFAVRPHWRRDCTVTLDAFYSYLVQSRTVDAEAGARIRAELGAERLAAEVELAGLDEPPRRPNRRERRARAAASRARAARRN